MVSIVVKSTSEAQQAFNEVVQNRLSDICSEPLIIVALAIWYEDFIPDITQLTRINEIARAGYVLEKLMTFHCVSIGTLIDPPICGVLDPLKTVFFVLKQSDYFLLCAPRPV